MRPVISPSDALLASPLLLKPTRHAGIPLWFACLVMFAEGFGATQIFPYGARMTRALHEGSNVGFYCGLLYSANSMGMLMSQRFWAALSLRYGCSRCLYVSNLVSLAAYLGAAVANNFWIVFAIMLGRGLLNCNLPVVRTALRQAYKHRGEEDTQAFSTLSVAFAASCICGPALGGILYSHGGPQPWSLVCFLSASFYIFPICSRFDDVVDKSGGEEDMVAVQKPKCLLIMGAAHSCVYTGWEFAYPLLASLPGGENWETARVGLTFLIGSIALMLYSTFVFGRLARRLGNVNLWLFSWVLPTLLIPLFPWLLDLALDHYTPQSAQVMSLNFGVQVVISVLLGSCFITIQLLINEDAELQPAPKAALALYNGWLASSQAFVRAATPLISGYIFEIDMLENHGSTFVFVGGACLVAICGGWGYRRYQPATFSLS